MSPAVPPLAYAHHQNPRSSLGSLSMPPVTSRSHIASPPSPTCSSCSSCSCSDSTLPLNTPWSTPPTSSTGSVATQRNRRRSVSEQHPILANKNHRAASPPRPLVIQKPVRSQSRERSSHGRHSSSSATRTLVVPASSHGHRRSRSDTSYSTHTARYYDNYMRSVEVARDQADGHEFSRHGRTRFPKKLVSRRACEEKGLPYKIEDNGDLTVLQVLGQHEIDALVALTEEIRRRDHPRKAVSFYEKTVVHEVPPMAPSPPPSETSASEYMPPPPPRSGTPVSPELLRQHSARHAIIIPGSSGSSARSRSHASSSSYLSDSPPKIEPLGPPGPSAPKPTNKRLSFTLETPGIPIPGGKSPEDKLVKAEKRAIKAEMIAEEKEQRALMTRRAADEREAWRARDKAEELKKKVTEKEQKEMLKYEKREIKRKVEREQRVRVGRNQRGEVILIKG